MDPLIVKQRLDLICLAHPLVMHIAINQPTLIFQPFTLTSHGVNFPHILSRKFNSRLPPPRRLPRKASAESVRSLRSEMPVGQTNPDFNQSKPSTILKHRPWFSQAGISQNMVLPRWPAHQLPCYDVAVLVLLILAVHTVTSTADVQESARLWISSRGIDGLTCSTFRCSR